MDARIKYGVDIAKGSDVTVLTIKAGLQLYSFQGKEAEAILGWHQQEIAKARLDELNDIYELDSTVMVLKEGVSLDTLDGKEPVHRKDFVYIDERIAELSQALRESKEE